MGWSWIPSTSMLRSVAGRLSPITMRATRRAGKLSMKPHKRSRLAMANADQNDRDYRVGRCQPPIHSRFRKGQSGNPKGRPPGSRNTATLWGEELDARVSITERGGRKNLTKMALIVKQVVNQAGSGNLRACELVFKMENLFKRGDT